MAFVTVVHSVITRAMGSTAMVMGVWRGGGVPVGVGESGSGIGGVFGDRSLCGW